VTGVVGKVAQRQFLSFLITGGIAALVNLGTRIAFNVAMPFEVAVIMAYLCGMTTAYVLARQFVFERSGRAVHEEYIRFALVNLIAIVQVWIVSVGLADIVFPRIGFDWYPYTVAHLVGIIVPVFTSYIGHKHFSFAPSIEKVQ
jgi:putative flippase GtrA